MAQKNITLGLVAHVDSGKTTLTEAMLVGAGALRQAGRVDHGDAFLDTHALERSRGITIFAKEARLTLPHTELTLLDTPGHADFGAEMERTLSVLDYALLIISGTDGVQAHTETLWRLLERYRLPVFIFINKMDRPGADRALILEELQRKLSPACLPHDTDEEALALCDERLMAEYLESGTLTETNLAAALARRAWFPCFWGAALRQEGIAELLEGLDRLTLAPAYLPDFAAKVYKISTDTQGSRLTHLKVTGGALKVRMALPGGEKITQIRLYNGVKYQAVEEVPAGTIAAVTGLSQSYAGEGLGAEQERSSPLLEPVISCRVTLPEGTDPHTALAQLRQLEQEDPQLHLEWEEQKREIRVRLMGEIQREILQSVAMERFGLAIGFEEGSILYKETIAAPVEGIGHYEPLRHYAEVHLLLEPGARGSGVQLAADCPPDTLAENWQRLILTHLAERTHPGVLIGAPLTDVKITLAAGRAHQKHTEGGDFRQATYRAVRQGLRMAEAKDGVQLLEPWYDFTLELPADALGRAMADVQRMCGSFEAPETSGGTVRLTGRLPVATARGYAREVAAYTHGLGRWAVLPAGYDACHNADEIVSAAGYDPDADVENPADSVFCAHGAGFVVPWEQVRSHMHVDSGWGKSKSPEQETQAVPQRRTAAYRATLEEDAELLKIFERTYGPIKRDPLAAFRPVQKRERPDFDAQQWEILPEYLLVDGYNIIFAWDELNALAKDSLEAARHKLMDILCNYAGYRRCVPILVFDAYKVRGGAREVEQYHNLYVVYTREAETADMYIERATHELAKEHRTRVVSSDGAEQIIVMGHGALRVSARAFEEEVRAVEKEIREFLGE